MVEPFVSAVMDAFDSVVGPVDSLMGRSNGIMKLFLHKVGLAVEGIVEFVGEIADIIVNFVLSSVKCLVDVLRGAKCVMDIVVQCTEWM